MDYQIHETQFQNPSTYAGLFGFKNPLTPWTTPEDYQARVKTLYFDCAASRAFIDKRADSVASARVEVLAGNDASKKLIASPNTIDNTFGQFLRVTETELALGGDAWWFLDQRVPGLDQLRVLRQDFIVQDPKNSTITYVPGRANNQGVAELRFTMQGQRTVSAEYSPDGKNWTQIKGHIFHIMRFNPLSSGQGSGDADAVMRSATTWINLYNMVDDRARSGGRKQGIIRAPELRTNEDVARWKANMEQLNANGQVNVLAQGAHFEANQLSFTDMDLIKLMEKCTRDIALALSVPAVFANLEGESSYAERRAADRIFYKSFVHPRATWIVEQLEAHLRRAYDPALRLAIDKTQIDYIKEELGEEQERKTKLGIYTINELRRITGDDDIEGGDVFPGASAPAADEAQSAATSEDAAVDQAISAALGKPREVGFNADTSRRPDQR